ncbi:dynein axonemal assembly factor 6-like isoform X2 [Homarus americanus]|uniref:dynein axonemal assembly factor 6-like isoform X2 n=1 Tax=Homarus americanus TaxID=6706 RepID=UPI001C4809C6|nr:dynein axonemal assembly factor 6-like isoform X2 [Homarus americanus]
MSIIWERYIGVTPADLVTGSYLTKAPAKVTNLPPEVTRLSTKVNPANSDLLGDIWEVEEVRSSQGEEVSDPRPQPEYDVTYKHRVSAAHVYLPVSSMVMGGAGEEDLVVRVVLPGAHLMEVTLEVTPTDLRLASPTHYLHLHLPRPVHQQKGVATWDPSTHTLTITLPTAHPLLLTPTTTTIH